MIDPKDIKLQFDGHGLNAQDGTRIAKVSIARLDGDGNVDPRFDEISKRIAIGFNRNSDLESLLFIAYEVLAEINDQDTGYYYQFQSAIQKALKAMIPPE